jgi:hypothetical protein
MKKELNDLFAVAIKQPKVPAGARGAAAGGGPGGSARGGLGAELQLEAERGAARMRVAVLEYRLAEGHLG